ncbi:silicon transporter [Nitzschia inconspicua]|uniref:Silicon transporter n=1 Tax=Nitzschia inconspicua TaxID=303405 RepID=A0A9K3K7Z9_9STRA|nr:silicon transporter [Nitzschia inconspicua]KAG7350766.1 silicon transporter [Nitzschia inconspicua]
MDSSAASTTEGDDVEMTIEVHRKQLSHQQEETEPEMQTPKVPMKRHIRNTSRGKSAASLEELVACRNDAFDGDLNPFEIFFQEDDAASVGCDKYKPLPFADPLGRAQVPPMMDRLPPTNHNTEIAASLPISEDEPTPARIPTTDRRSSSNAVSTDDSTLRMDPEIVNNDNGEIPASAEEAPRSVLSAGIEAFKYLYSLALLIFCVVQVMGAIFTQQTTSTANGFPAIGAFFIFWFLIFWLAMMEGGQGALVGLQPIDRQLYKESHPRAYKISGIVHRGDNMERLIVGRQFLVVLVVFVSQLMSSAVPNIELWGISKEATEVFLNSGVALMVVTIVLGQLTAQINAANCMLDFINNYFMLYIVTYFSLAIEYSGMLHSVYLVQMFFSKYAGKDEEKEQPPMNLLQRFFFWMRVVFSLSLLGFSFAVTLSALFQSKTTMWTGVPEWVSVVLFFLLMCFVGLMEGLQIALFAVVNIPAKDLESRSTVAFKNCQLTFRGQNLQAFLIGRQICVTICTFVIARITTLDVQIGVDTSIFGVSDGIQSFFNTGLLGAVITTIVSSLAWRIVASSFPIAFLSNPLIGIILRLCLLLEASGICSSAWVLARYHKPIVNYQPDDVHLEGSEPHTAEPVTARDKDIDRFVSVLRYSFSLITILFCCVLVVASIVTKKTKATVEIGLHPAIVLTVFLLFIIWLAFLEGGQGCIIGLQPIPEEKYAHSHPLTLKNTSIAYERNNLQGFIIGRQFLVLAVVFLIQWITEPITDATVLGLPMIFNDIFLKWGLAIVLITISLGQLTSQVNTASCMLDFINNRFSLYFVTYFSLIIDWTGVLHVVYAFRYLIANLSRNDTGSIETRTGIQLFLFWTKVFFSACLLVFSCAATLVGVIGDNNVMWKDVPDYGLAIIFVILICTVGMMEGVQIALFAVSGLSETELISHRVAHANCKLAFAEHNLQAFLVGRQVCVTFGFFVVAQVATWTVPETSAESNIFGVSNGTQQFLNTGLLGAFVTAVLASLVWRVMAASFPVSFMSNPLIYLIIRFCLLVESSGICSSCWIFGRWNKLLAGYQPDDVYTEGAEKQGKAPVTRRDKDVDVTITVIKYIFSTALLAFGIAITMFLIFTGQTQLAMTAHPAVAFVLIWFLLVWLAMMEGGQGCLVGLQGVKTDLYKDSHPVTLKNTKVVFKGDNMQRFIVGRQFLVVLVVFVTNMCGFPVEGAQAFELPDTVAAIFVDSGLSLILMTVVLGQLTAQVNAATCMLDFSNNYFLLYCVTYVSMIIEASGILHCVFLVQMLFAKFAGIRVTSNEPPPTCLQRFFFWCRAIFSLALLCFSFAVTLSALFGGQTTTWGAVSDGVSVLIFFILMIITGLMEGMQIALFAVVNLPEKELAHYKLAKATCQLTFQGNNLQAFLIGRQICVTLCTFFIARITTIDVTIGAGENIYGVSDGIQAFFNTGLLGALITTIVGSLAWRIIASSFPLAFLSNPLIYLILRLCLVIEASGVCSSAWLLALINRQIFGFQDDEVYIGRPEVRNAVSENVAVQKPEAEAKKAPVDNDIEASLDRTKS